MDSPVSPLSELSSDDFHEETRASVRSMSADPFRDHDHDGESTRPSKRARIGGSNAWEVIPQALSDADISPDTDGSVPGSPHLLAGDDEDGGGFREQVTICKWEGCDAGDLGNMDLLVQHLHDEHIQARQKKYSCEWADCPRKGIPHASGYALRAHMRSHTREKPFYCSLPECDRSFTRSDALAKHMRTVHETEALRPSDPVPKHHSSNPQNKAQRIKLTLKGLTQPHSNGDGKDALKPSVSNPVSPSFPPPASPADAESDHNNVTYVPRPGGSPSELEPRFPSDIHFTPEELALPAPELLRLLRKQEQWALADGEELRAELERAEQLRRREWEAKELVLENYLECEAAVAERRRRNGRKPAPSFDEEEATAKMSIDVAPSKRLEMVGDRIPWWRQSGWANGHGGPPAGALKKDDELAPDGHEA